MNVTRVSRAPEAYAITESKTVMASPRWKRSDRRSGDCISIMPDGTTRVMSSQRSSIQRQRRTRIIEVKETRAEMMHRIISDQPKSKWSHDYTQG